MEQTLKTFKTLQDIQCKALEKKSVDSFFLDIFMSHDCGPVISVSAYKTEDFEDDSKSVVNRIYTDTPAETVERIINNLKALCL